MGLSVAEFNFHIPLKPKARPRSVDGKQPYMPADYKRWVKEMRAQMAEHWTDKPLNTVNVLWCKFYGPARSDLDNLLGAVMDAGNGLIWRDDRVSIIARVEAEWEKAKIADQCIQTKVFYELSAL